MFCPAAFGTRSGYAGIRTNAVSFQAAATWRRKADSRRLCTRRQAFPKRSTPREARGVLANANLNVDGLLPAYFDFGGLDGLLFSEIGL